MVIKELIPVVVVACELLAACGGPCREMCSKYEECYKADFEDEYSDLDDCVEECEDEADDWADESDNEEDCRNAIDSMYTCFGDLDCSDLQDEDECEDEQDDMVDECNWGDMVNEVGDSNVDYCDSQGDGQCDEPEGTGVCAEGMDPDDCLNDGVYTVTCEFQEDGECDEPEGTGACGEGSDPVDCGG